MQLLPGLVPLLHLYNRGCHLQQCLKAYYQTALQSLLSCNTQYNSYLCTIQLSNERVNHAVCFFFLTLNVLPYLAICSSAWQCPLIFCVSSESIFRLMMQRCLKACRSSSLRRLSSTWAQVWLMDCSVSKWLKSLAREITLNKNELWKQRKQHYMKKLPAFITAKGARGLFRHPALTVRNCLTLCSQLFLCSTDLSVEVTELSFQLLYLPLKLSLLSSLTLTFSLLQLISRKQNQQKHT